MRHRRVRIQRFADSHMCQLPLMKPKKNTLFSFKLCYFPMCTSHSKNFLVERKKIMVIGKLEGVIIMNVDVCVQFANQNPVSFLSSTDGDQPRVRGLLLWFADKTGFYYNVGAVKEVYKQLKVNPKVEVCFFNAKSKSMDQMRVTGQVEFLNDLELKKKLVEARPSSRSGDLPPVSYTH